MKGKNRVFLIAVVFIVIAAVSTFLYITSAQGGSEQTVRDFLQKYYTVTAEENKSFFEGMGTHEWLDKSIHVQRLEYEPFFTEKAFDRFVANRDSFGVNLMAQDLSEDISIKNLALEVKEKYQNKVVYLYRVELIIVKKGDSQVINRTKKGEIRVVKEGSKWLIEYAKLDFNILK